MENIKFLKKVYRMFFSMSKEQEKIEYIKILQDEIKEQNWNIQYHSRGLMKAENKLKTAKQELKDLNINYK